MRSPVIAMIMLALAGSVSAEVVPQPGGIDSRVQSVTYDASDVVRLRVPVGYQLTVELAPDERIENVAVGDAGAWLVTPNRRGDHLFIKPIQAGVQTNMVVVTDSRTYAMVLEPAEAPGPDIPFTIRYRYPAPGAAIEAPRQSAIVGRYRLKGDHALRPDAIGDDGRRTIMTWPALAALPAVFALELDGHETLVNGHTENGALVVEGVASRYIFRLGKAVARADRTTPVAR